MKKATKRTFDNKFDERLKEMYQGKFITRNGDFKKVDESTGEKSTKAK